MRPLRGDLEVRHCRVLVAVDEAGGIVAAARALGLSQSTVSETLLALERTIGMPVLERAPGRLGRLSAAGEALLPHARALIETSERALAALSTGERTMRLGVVESVSSFLLPQPLREVRRRWPTLEVRVLVGLCDDLRRRTSDDDLDAAITIEGTRARHGADTRPLSPARLELIVAGSSPLAGRRVARDALRSHALLLSDPLGAFNSALREWFGPGRRGPRFESAGSIDGVKRGVLAGDAIGVLPAYACSEEIAAGTLATVQADPALPDIALFLTTPRSAPPSPALRIVTEQICRTLQLG